MNAPRMATLTAVAGALALVALLGASWYQVTFEAASATLASGTASGWMALHGADVWIAALAAVAALATVIEELWGPRPLADTVAVLSSVAALTLVAIHLADPPDAAGSNVDLELGAWLALASAAVLVIAVVFAVAPRRVAAPALALLATLGLGASVASAHTLENQFVYWKQGFGIEERCAIALGRITHGNYGHGFVRANTYATKFEPLNQNDCAMPWPQNANHVRARFSYLRLTNNQWAYCDGSDYKYNSDGGFWRENYRNYGRAPCAKGNYKMAGGHGLLNGGTWFSAISGAGPHYFD